MRIGVLREIKDNENRVALVPRGAAQLVGDGHQVLVETGAGLGSGHADPAYEAAGATVCADAAAVCRQADLVVKVKEPQPVEYDLFRAGQVVFTYFHLAANRELTLAMRDRGIACVAYETVQSADGRVPLLAPMSEVSGSMAPLIAAGYLARPAGGAGVLLSRVAGAPPARLLVLGGGTVGRAAARVARGVGARVWVIEQRADVRQALAAALPGIECRDADARHLGELLPQVDVLIGAVHRPGARTPVLVSQQLVATMQPGAVIVDVAIDQGGCIATSRATTHSDPVYRVHGVIHYCVSNMPGAYPRTATDALTTATLPYVRRLAGSPAAALAEPELRSGLNVYRGCITHRGVAAAHDLVWTDPTTIPED